MIFIFYTRYKPVIIDALSRLKKRLPERHPMYEKVSTDLYNYTSGFGGEERVDQVLRRVAFAEPYALLPNLHLHDPIISNSQIDVLIGTSKYFSILEVKNWTGSLDFKDSPRQVIQTTSTYTKSHDCPCVQAETIRDRLVRRLKRNEIEIPVFHAVIFPYAYTIINKSTFISNVHVASELPILFKEYENRPSLITDDLFHSTITSLWSENTPFTLNPLCTKYFILPRDLKRGLFCSSCDFHLLKKSSRSYYCPSCMTMPSNPFADAMTDWFFLVGPSISNRELKAFTNTKTSHTVGYFMRSSGYVRTGNTRDSLYRSEIKIQ